MALKSGLFLCDIDSCMNTFLSRTLAFVPSPFFALSHFFVARLSLSFLWRHFADKCVLALGREESLLVSVWWDLLSHRGKPRPLACTHDALRTIENDAKSNKIQKYNCKKSAESGKDEWKKGGKCERACGGIFGISKPGIEPRKSAWKARTWCDLQKGAIFGAEQKMRNLSKINF